jgi:hypothetical protein
MFQCGGYDFLSCPHAMKPRALEEMIREAHEHSGRLIIRLSKHYREIRSENTCKGKAVILTLTYFFHAFNRFLDPLYVLYILPLVFD